MKLFNDAGLILREHVCETALPRELIPLLDKLTHARRGWVLRNIHEEGTVETAVQHVAKLVLAACEIKDLKRWSIDPLTLKKQVLIHELPEIKEVGGVDWVPGEKSQEEKLALERAQLERLLPVDFPRRTEIIQLWEEYEKGGLAYCLDKMDAVITAVYYELANPMRQELEGVTDSFFSYATTKIDDKSLIKVMETVRNAARVKNGKTRVTPNDLFPFYFDELSSI